MKGKTAFGFAAVAISCLLIGYAVTEYSWILRLHQNPTLRANVFLIMEKHGVDARMIQGNVITDLAENFTRNHFSRGVSVNITKLAVGNVSAPLQTKTVLTQVYTDPTDGAYPEGTVQEWVNSGDAAVNVTRKWTFEETVNLNGAAGYLGNTTFAFAIANFPGGPQTFNSGENLTVRFAYTFNAND